MWDSLGFDESAFLASAGMTTPVGEAVRILGEGVGLEIAVNAGAVGRLGQAMLAAGIAERAEDLAPRYVRRAEAEARLTGQPLEEGATQARP